MLKRLMVPSQSSSSISQLKGFLPWMAKQQGGGTFRFCVKGGYFSSLFANKKEFNGWSFTAVKLRYDFTLTAGHIKRNRPESTEIHPISVEYENYLYSRWSWNCLTTRIVSHYNLDLKRLVMTVIKASSDFCGAVQSTSCDNFIFRLE